MASYLAPGVYVEEKSSGSKPIAGVGTSNGGFIGFTEKGPIDKAELVTSWTQFTEKFGSFKQFTELKEAYLPLAVYQFFNEGGTTCFIVRREPGATKATQTSVINTTLIVTKLMTNYTNARTKATGDALTTNIGKYKLLNDFANSTGTVAGANLSITLPDDLSLLISDYLLDAANIVATGEMAVEYSKILDDTIVEVNALFTKLITVTEDADAIQNALESSDFLSEPTSVRETVKLFIDLIKSTALDMPNAKIPKKMQIAFSAATPGSWAKDRVKILVDKGTAVDTGFKLSVKYKEQGSIKFELVEEYDNLLLKDLKDTVKESSTYINIDSIRKPTGTTNPIEFKTQIILSNAGIGMTLNDVNVANLFLLIEKLFHFGCPMEF